MTTVTVPYDFVGGTRAIANQVDANFSALVDAFNSNVGTALQAATTFYVSPTGSDSAGNGLASTSPAASVAYIINLLQTTYFLNMQTVTIQMANGTYSGSQFFVGAMPGLQAANHLIIQGNMANPANVVVQGDSNSCFNFSNGALATLQGMTLQSATGNCIIAQTHSRLLFSNIVFGTALGAHIVSARGSTMHAQGNYTITGGAAQHVLSLEHGECYLDPEPANFMNFTPGSPTITLTGTPAFSFQFIAANTLGLVKVGAVFSGTATGQRYRASLNGAIHTFAQGGNAYIPGNAAGALVTGGQIDVA